MVNKKIIKKLFDDDLSFVVYGAGNRGSIIVKTLLNLGISVSGIIDSDQSKQGRELHGICIFERSFLETLNADTYVIVSIYNATSILAELEHVCKVMPIETGEYIIRLSYLDCESYGYERLEGITHWLDPFPVLDNKKADKTNINSITFNIEKQEQYFKEFIDEYKRINKKDLGQRYYTANGVFPEVDALTLYGMIKHIKPKKIIEIGSGLSSAVMLDINEYCVERKIDLVFIEPFPDRLKSILKENDRITLYEKRLQDVDQSVFDSLEPGDILFIDSTHVSKYGSDVNELVFNIIPNLPRGVYIHIHDIYKDFEYPVEWLRRGWIWNEDYIVRAFLMNNNDYEIEFMSDIWNDKFASEGITESGGCLWIKKL
ncbi:Methyltransferase domain-containing protein [Lachnospiraceae bacterium XPB1003]|nr:Methyltransferase domain-containing protein [Lachnospiraceae bacterium XPB1003]